MKVTTYPQMVAVSGSTPMEAAENFNRIMYQYRDKKPTFERAGETTFYVFYSETESIPTTLADIYEMKNCTHKCSECPHFIRELTRFGEVDRRKKWGNCELTGESRTITSAACEQFYEELEKKAPILSKYKKEA